MTPRFEIRWGSLLAIEPSPAEVAVHSASLAASYNEPHNAHMLGHTETLDAADVIELYAEMAADGDRPFLLFDDGALAGDGDLRNVANQTAELAFLIAAPAAQGKGLGTRFATMMLAFAFDQHRLGLARVYASVAPHNPASRRVFDKLGFALDGAPAARGFADEPDDLVFAIDREEFALQNAAAVAAIAIAIR